MKENYINHIALVLDASGSMQHRAKDVIKVADQQIAHLAQRSKEMDQETRVTVYSFSDAAKCLIYDKDVLRLPSIAGIYDVGGNTALIDATLKSLTDLSATPEIYGDHSFLVYVITDGEENESRAKPSDLSQRLAGLPSHWTVAAFVPDASGLHEAKRFGFTKDNVAIWDATSAKGVAEAGERIRQVTDYYMAARSTGLRGSRNLFTMATGNIDTTALSKCQKLTPGQFRMLAVAPSDPVVIADFVEAKTSRAYRLGEAYYQLSKPEKVSPSKAIAIMDRKAFSVYTGRDARSILGLPDHEVKVEPATHPAYDLFVQSTSTNRKLVPGTSLLLLS
jgi:hypothetical protein